MVDWARVGWLAAVVTAVAFVCYGTWLNGMLHERQYGFARLTDMQKGMTMHSEQAFYISYFFDTIRAASPFHAFFNLVSDTVSEAPDTINVLNRFNIYPEFVLGLLHRPLSIFVNINGFTFVLAAIFLLAGIQLGALFLLGRLVSGSYLGGVITACAFVFNLNETTRVYSNPLLRESFSLPFLWIQIALVVRVLRQPKRRALPAPVEAKPEAPVNTAGLNKKAAAARRKMIARSKKAPSRWQRIKATVQPSLALYPELIYSTFFFMISWQFSQFIMFLQSAALLATHLLGYIPGVMLFDILICTMAGALLVVIAMWGNLMLLGSLFLCFAGAIVLLQVKGYFLLEVTDEPRDKQRARRPIRGIVEVPTGPISRFLNAVWGVIIAFLGMFVAKFFFSAITAADAHVFNLLKAKLTDYEDYDTALYLCGSAYGLLPWSMWNNLGETLLSHRAVAVAAIILLQMLLEFFTQKRSADPALVFLFWQTLAFFLLGVTIMRLMLFFTPSFCVLASLLASPQFFRGVLDTLQCRKADNQHDDPAPAAGSGDEDEDTTAKRRRESKKPKKATAESEAEPEPRVARPPPGALFVVVALLLGGASLAATFHLGGPILEEKIDTITMTDPSGFDDTVELMEWINQNTRKESVVVSSLALSSTIKLATGRSLAIHPHAEDAGMRRRYRLLYTMYDKISQDAVYASMRALQGDLLVIPFTSCDGKCSNGKSLQHVASLGAPMARRIAELWDEDQVASRQLHLTDKHWEERHDQFCFLITEEPMRKFKALFQNDKFLVLRIPY